MHKHCNLRICVLKSGWNSGLFWYIVKCIFNENFGNLFLLLTKVNWVRIICEKQSSIYLDMLIPTCVSLGISDRNLKILKQWLILLLRHEVKHVCKICNKKCHYKIKCWLNLLSSKQDKLEDKVWIIHSCCIILLFYFCSVTQLTPAFIASFETFCNFDNVLLWCAEYKVGSRPYKLFIEKCHWFNKDL